MEEAKAISEKRRHGEEAWRKLRPLVRRGGMEDAKAIGEERREGEVVEVHKEQAREIASNYRIPPLVWRGK